MDPAFSRFLEISQVQDPVRGRTRNRVDPGPEQGKLL